MKIQSLLLFISFSATCVEPPLNDAKNLNLPADLLLLSQHLRLFEGQRLSASLVRGIKHTLKDFLN